MYYKFDVQKWILHQLPIILRRSVFYEFVRSCLHGIRKIYEEFYSYCQATDRQLGHNANTLMLQKWLNDVFFLSDGTIFLSNYLNDQVYFHYEDETPEEIYMSYQTEGDGVYLNSSEPGSEYGGFIVNIPVALGSQDNIAIIKKWVEYYKTAGVVYRIEKYE